MLCAEHQARRALPEEIHHWLSAAQAARVLGLSTHTFHLSRMTGTLQIRHKQQLYDPGHIGNDLRFDPDDVASGARRLGVRPRSAPRGTLSSLELLALGQLGRRTHVSWNAKGLPFVLDVRGAAHYRPAQVLAWVTKQLEHLYTRLAALRRMHDVLTMAHFKENYI